MRKVGLALRNRPALLTKLDERVGVEIYVSAIRRGQKKPLRRWRSANKQKDIKQKAGKSIRAQGRRVFCKSNMVTFPR